MEGGEGKEWGEREKRQGVKGQRLREYGGQATPFIESLTVVGQTLEGMPGAPVQMPFPGEEGTPAARILGLNVDNGPSTFCSGYMVNWDGISCCWSCQHLPPLLT